MDTDQIAAVKQLLSNTDLWKESEELSQLFDYLDALGVSEYVRYEPKIIRGLDYYTGLVFEAHEVNGDFRAILGGGHYSNLVEDVGGEPLSGVGFAMGDVVVMLVLEKYGLLPKDLSYPGTVFVTVFNEDLLVESIRLTKELREEGFYVILAEPDKLARQFKLADRLGVKFALVLGPDELATQTVIVKDLHTFEQRSVQRTEIKAIFS